MACGWLVWILSACSADSDLDEARSDASPQELSFGLAHVPLASAVALSEFHGAPLVPGVAQEGCASRTLSLRLIRADTDSIRIDDEPLLELEQGLPQMALKEARAALEDELSARAEAGVRWAEQSCENGESALHPRRVLLAIESSLPIDTVQLLLQSVQGAGLDQPSVALNADRSPEDMEWSTTLAPPVLLGPGMTLDESAVGSRGVVVLGDAPWSEAARDHSRLASLGVGCVSYAWGAGQQTEMHPPTPQALSESGMVSVLAISPLQIGSGDVAPAAQELVTGARCGDWGHLGTMGSRPSVEP